jgi:hypothetical protein
MTDLTRDPFETRLAAALEDYVAGARDPRPVAQIADAAMRPRSVGQRLGAIRSRRLLLLGLAAVLLVPTAYFGARLLLPPAPVVDNEVPAGNYRAIVVRRTPGVQAGVAILAVAGDGSEKLVRSMPDSVLPNGLTFSEWGSVSQTGWIALAEEQKPWNMVLVDLRDANSQPWIVPGTSLGGVGPAWGPQGLVAAPLDLSNVWIFDPDTRQRVGTVHGGLIGGGPSIVWTEDGSGLISQQDDSTYGVLPIDGGPFIPGPQRIFGSRAGFGDELTRLRVCADGGQCSTADGSVELVTADGSATTIWRQTGGDRASGASFGDADGDYLIQVDGDSGRKVGVVLVTGGSAQEIVSIDRPLDWDYYFLSGLAPDNSFATFFVDLGNETYGAVFAPMGGGAATYHHAAFSGYLAAATADSVGTSDYGTDGVQPLGQGSQDPYPLTSVEDLIAAETALNPGEVAVGQNSANAVDGDGTVETYPLTATATGNLEAYIDCFGAASVTVTFGSAVVRNPCTSTGSYSGVIVMEKGDVATITASHDTSWRVVLYTADLSQFEGTPPPVPGPVDTPKP